MKDFTLIRMLVDRSGSMQSVQSATVAGINEYITIQKNAPGDGHIKVVQFDENEGKFTYDTILDKHLSEATLITPDQFQPRGMTPLFDAMGRTINELGDELRHMSEDERPSRILVCVVTDGENNASKEYRATQIKEMVGHQREKYNWQFTYVGANQDAFLVGDSIGIVADSCMAFTADAGHTMSAFRSMGQYTNRLRASSPMALNKVAYTVQERSDSKVGDEDDPTIIIPNA
jgi:uncharacterized protein YegL